MKVVLKNVRINFPTLFKAEVPERFPNQKPSYSANFTIDKGSDNLKKLEEAIEAAAIEKWADKGKKKVAEYRANTQRFCMKDGDNTEKDYLKGKMTLTAKRQEQLGRPLVIDALKSPITIDDGKNFNGATVNASVVIWAQDGANPGIRCQLLSVQLVKEGSGGGATPTDADFDEITLDDEDDLA